MSSKILRDRRTLSLSAIVGAALVAVTAAAAPPHACTGEGRLSHICGLNNPEDLLRLDGTPWVLVSNMGDRNWAAGGFNLIDVRNRSHRALVPTFSSPPVQAYRGCQSPEPAKFSAHGLSVRSAGDGRFRVWAVNHGGRQSVEVFDLNAGSDKPSLTWVGCAVLPKGLSANSVAALPGEAFAATVFSSPGNAATGVLHDGLPSGVVMEWAVDEGWRSVPGSEFAGVNGIVASPDGKWLYVAGYLDGTVNKLSRGQAPYVVQKIKLHFLVDNIRFSPSGSLLVTGQPATPFKTIQRDCNGSAVAVCAVPTAVALVDPVTLAAKLLLIEQNTANFGGGTAAIVVGDELWIGAFRAQRIATIPVAAIGSPDL